MKTKFHTLNFRAFLFIIIISHSFLSCKKKYATENVIYKNGDIIISARIYKPVSGSNFPVVVIVPSAEPDTKETYSDYAEHFATNGIVTICYDKRGTGQSTGNIMKADFNDLFFDAYAGISYIKELPYVDTTQMGFIGHSQGGMYIFMADSITNDIAFLIDISGSAASPLDQSHYNIYSKIKENGGSEKYADSLAFLMDDYIRYLSARNNYTSIKSRVEVALSDPEKPAADKINYFDQFKYLYPPEQLPLFDAMEMYPFMRSCNYEARKFFSTFSIPALMIYGKKDRVINSAFCVEIAKQAEQQNDLIDVKVYENANHTMKEETLTGKGYPDNFFEDLTSWIKLH
ncbi:MAG: alpha/beta fold hydrolase [Fimbriimonadaceae bacterium]|nr:alpha/beta fold hydrolase [Chitinophagales bacterium]